jgi:hypothetical protein
MNEEDCAGDTANNFPSIQLLPPAITSATTTEQMEVGLTKLIRRPNVMSNK